MILANSFYSRESILRAYGLDSKVCYLGVDTVKFRQRDVAKTNEVIGIGAFVREKNIEFVIKAVGAVRAPRPKLTWIGNAAWPPYLEELRRFAGRCDVELDARVRVADDELLEALSRAFAFVYASRLEPFGLAPLEAGACGLPVIAVAEGGVRETILDHVNGLVVEHDPGAMANAIERLRDDPECARSLGERGEHLVRERWSLRGAIDGLERRFSDVLRSRRTPRLSMSEPETEK
jgi:glycosyltransferase involved in cell wall biosynthesis